MTPINQSPNLADILKHVDHATDERDLPLYARGGLLGIYGWGPNPARERIEELRKQHDQ